MLSSLIVTTRFPSAKPWFSVSSHRTTAERHYQTVSFYRSARFFGSSSLPFVLMSRSRPWKLFPGIASAVPKEGWRCAAMR